jgi:hypothetical protein
MSRVPLAVLDLSPISEGSTPGTPGRTQSTSLVTPSVGATAGAGSLAARVSTRACTPGPRETPAVKL